MKLKYVWLLLIKCSLYDFTIYTVAVICLCGRIYNMDFLR